MDTEITYKYKDDTYEGLIVEGRLTLDKSFYKNYTKAYETSVEDDYKNLARRLWNCHLRATGDVQCKEFLTDILHVCINDEYEAVYCEIIKHELIEVIFQMN